jgi:hypothetical protein
VPWGASSKYFYLSTDASEVAPPGPSPHTQNATAVANRRVRNARNHAEKIERCAAIELRPEADRCLHRALAMVAHSLQTDDGRSPATRAIVTPANLETTLHPLQVACVLRQLQARVAAAGPPVTLAVDDTVHVLVDEKLLISALGNLFDYAAEQGAETLVLRVSSEEPGVLLELELDGTHLASGLWQELQSSAPHSPRIRRAARAFEEMQAKLELQHTNETSASLLILFPAPRASYELATE